MEPISCSSQMLTKKQEKIFSSSLEEAEKSNLLFKHGCVATYGGHIIASGYNTHKNYSQHDEFVHNQCSCHAEMNVLRKIYYRYRKMKKIHKLNRIMKRTTLYISRCSNSGTSTNSAPCAKCLEVIQSFHIRKIVFHMNDDYYEYNPRDFETNHRTFGELTLLEKNKSQ
jgi:tRNA(Arg) A34 adenosine deaminase TadA